MGKRLTYRQARILAYIRTYRAERGYPPSFREIGAAIGLRAVSSVHRHLEALRREGRVCWTPGKARTLRLIEEEP